MQKTGMKRMLALLLALLFLLAGCQTEGDVLPQTEGNKLPLPIDRALYFGMTLSQVETLWGEAESKADTASNGGQNLTYSRQVLGVTATATLSFYPIGNDWEAHTLLLQLPCAKGQERQQLTAALVTEIEAVYGSNEAFSWQQEPDETSEAPEGAFAVDLGATGLYGTITGDDEGIWLQCYNVE